MLFEVVLEAAAWSRLTSVAAAARSVQRLARAMEAAGCVPGAPVRALYDVWRGALGAARAREVSPRNSSSGAVE